ncbi:MBL fold metallo-hydrolase [Mycobacterium sp. C3-094]
MTDRIQLGRATLTRVVELRVQMTTSLFGQTPAHVWADHADLLEPLFWDRAADQWKIAMQTWVLQVDGLIVLVDTGVGNDRDRPHFAPLHQLQTGYLDTLAAAGVAPDDVDVVINTHLHTDHVGWNTRLVDGAWVPTFPNARYLMPDADYRHFSPDGDSANKGMRIVFADSVIPVAGQTELYSGDHQLSDSLWLRPASGHTPGSSVVWLDAGVPAVFVGDLTHCPIQLVRPDDACAFDEDPEAAARTRHRVLTEAARRGAIVIPAHYPGRGGATLDTREDGFAVGEWLALSAI